MKEKVLAESKIHYYISENTSDKAILFLPPIFLDHSALRYQIEYFYNKYKIIVIDLPGFGNSISSSSDILDSENVINKILNTEKIAKVNLVSIGFSGIILQSYAYNHPSRVLSLSCFSCYDISGITPKIKHLTKSLIRNFYLHRIISKACFTKFVNKLYIRNTIHQSNFKTILEKNGLKQIKSLSKISKISYPKLIRKKLNCPIYIANGEYDLKLVSEANKSWACDSKEIVYSIFKNTGHFPNLESSQAFNSGLESFLLNNEKRVEEKIEEKTQAIRNTRELPLIDSSK